MAGGGICVGKSDVECEEQQTRVGLPVLVLFIYNSSFEKINIHEIRRNK